MTTALAFVDTETTGLDPETHEVWEVGLILRHSLTPGHTTDEEHTWRLKPRNLAQADPMALQISRFYERTAGVGFDDPCDFAHDFAALTSRAHLVGAVISFDALRLDKLLRFHNVCPAWHYHIIDVEALAAGLIAMDSNHVGGRDHKICVPPWDSTELSKAVGVDPELFDRHTALGDAEWARAIYDKVIGAS